MDRSALLKAFNTQLFAFMDDIIAIFPENEKIKYTRTTMDMFRKTNVTGIVKSWHYFICRPYKAQIDAGDIDYFLNKDYAEDLVYMGERAGKIEQTINELRDPIKQLSDTNKAHALKYMQNLCTLCEMYVGPA
jgi:hypothetical protein